MLLKKRYLYPILVFVTILIIGTVWYTQRQEEVSFKADTVTNSRQPGCISINNISNYSGFKIVFVGGFGMSFVPFSNSTCLDLDWETGGQVAVVGGKFYAIKNSDWIPPYTTDDGAFRLLREQPSVLIHAPLGYNDYFPVADPNITKLEIELTIATITSNFNLEIVSKTYTYRDGTKKTEILKQVSPSPIQVSPSPPPPTSTPKTTIKPKTGSSTSLSSETIKLTKSTKILSDGTSSDFGIDQPIKIYKEEKLTLTGTTSTDAKITLTIQSDPITQDITADKDGNWTYTLDPTTLALEVGTHTVSAVVTDTAGKVSESVELTNLTIKTPLTEEFTTTDDTNRLPTVFYVLLSLTVIGLFVYIILIVIRYKKQGITWWKLIRKNNITV